MLQTPTLLSTLCPQCFGDNQVVEVGFISFDGNFQRKHFPTKKDADNKYLKLRDKCLFIDDGTMPDEVSVHSLHFADPMKPELYDDIITTCGRNFTSATEKNAPKLKAVIDSGIMATVCRCGM